MGLAKSRDQHQPLSSENEHEYDDGGDDDDDTSDDKSKFPTNCTIRSSDTPTCFGHKSQPFARQLQYLRTQAECRATCQPLMVNYKQYGTIPQLINNC